MTNETTLGSTVAVVPDIDTRRAAADTALEDAVLEWLHAYNLIPANRAPVAVDFAVPYVARWLTSSGRTGRKGGTITVGSDVDPDAVQRLLWRQAGRMRDAACAGWWVPKVPAQCGGLVGQAAHPLTCLTGCSTDHAQEGGAARTCRALLGCINNEHEDYSTLWLHAVRRSGDERTETWFELSVWNQGCNATVVAELDPYWAHLLACHLLDEIERLT